MFRRRRRRDEPSEVEAVSEVEEGSPEGAETDETAYDEAVPAGDPAAAEDETGASAGGGLGAAVSGDDLRASGPWDLSEVDDPAEGGRVDLGGMWLPGREGM